ncbi:MAG: hypothetical protein QM660_13065 [Dysgonomonas sp.]
MKDLDLTTLGVEEMTELEVKEVEGGFGLIPLVICAIYRDEFKKGFQAGLLM